VSSGESGKRLEELRILVLQTMPLIHNLKAAKYRIIVSNNHPNIKVIFAAHYKPHSLKAKEIILR